MTDEPTAGDDARTDREAPRSKKADDSEADMAYWQRNLEAALSSMEPETGVTPRHNADDLVITPVGGSSRDERAELIHALEVRGFEVVSSSQQTYIQVDVTDDRLNHPFANGDREDRGDLITDGGHLPGHTPGTTSPNPEAEPETSSPRPNGGEEIARIPELPGFERDILLTLSLSGPTSGRGLLDDLASLRDEDVSDARLYTHLNELAENGLVEKRENYHDDRSHEFRLSNAGRYALREHAQHVTGAIDALEEGDR